MLLLSTTSHYEYNFPYREIGNFITSCRDKLYHHTTSNKIKFNFLIILFGKMPSSKPLPSSGTESEIERMTDFEKFLLVTIHSWTNKIKSSSFLCGRNSVSDLASSNDVATKGVSDRFGYKTWCICECCASMDTNRRCLLPRNSWDLQSKNYKYIVFERL